MTAPYDPPTPRDAERHPELPLLAALDEVLDMTSVSLCAHYPETLPPDWPLGSPRPPDPAAHVANVLLTLVEVLRQTTRVYRETIARDLVLPCAMTPEPDDDIAF
jgi:hypothetical protein